ncbi:SMC-Scp complex subunit ScpB [Clostridium sp.]|uniref:SMC-Scp complex subunit ScpB n=1 Tax=Clostridium sp. TaxID=1506 RepID=UPI003A5BE343
MDNKKHCNITEIDKHKNNHNIYFSVIESLLFVSGEAMDIVKIAKIIECSIEFTRSIMDEMIELYKASDRGIKVICSEGKYSLVTKNENSKYVEKLLGPNSRQSLSQASLETLSIIAYKQPITRVDIDEIRGVKSDRAIYNLLQKGLIKESGRLNVPGRPILYSTTETFLKHFGFENIDMIPTLDQLLKE